MRVIDKELQAARKARWQVAFSEEEELEEPPEVTVNRKATIVIEHLIQASDISHTMQHWHIYSKWVSSSGSAGWEDSSIVFCFGSQNPFRFHA